VVISVPSSFLNGSGSRAIDGRPVALGSAATVQLAPSSSEDDASEALAATPASPQTPGGPASTPLPEAPPLAAPPPAPAVPPAAVPPAPPVPGRARLELLQARMARHAGKTRRPEKVGRRFMA